MTRTPQSDSQDDHARDDLLDEVFGTANPNPDRVGCPSRDVLTELATRQRAIGDPAYVHLTRCSPCYREFREIQKQVGQ